MFCKNCGKENISGDDTCEFCGFEFSKSVFVENISTNSTVHKIKSNKRLKTSLISIALVFVALFAFYKIGTELTKPERVIKKYISALVNSDYETIYDTLDIGDDELLSKDIFLSSFDKSENADNIEITSINITTATDDDMYSKDEPLPNSKVDLVYKVIYTTQIERESKTEIINMTKTGKSLLFFNKYKIHPNKYITTNFSIDAPPSAEVILDGIELDETFFSEDIKRFIVPKVFFGTHTVTIKSEYTEDYEEEFEISQNLTLWPELILKSDLSNKMIEKTENTLRTLFNGMVSNKSFEEIKTELDFIESQTEKIEENYSSFCDTNWSGFSGSDFVYVRREFESIVDESAQCAISSVDEDNAKDFVWKPFECRISYNVGYEVKSAEGKYVIFWGDTVGEKNFNITITYCLENGNLKIYSIINQRSF